ncbi:hypothetical protein ACLB2K_045143 [Fragaria x ananassa]
MAASGGRRLSGMQKQVLGLYRGFLRAARTKSAEDRHKIESLVSNEFRYNAKNVDRKNFLYIEYLLRRGKKQLDQLKSPDTVGLSALNEPIYQEPVLNEVSSFAWWFHWNFTIFLPTTYNVH